MYATHEDHRNVLELVRVLSSELKAPVTVLQDLQGPKIRVGKMEGGQLLLEEGKLYKVSPEFKVGRGDEIPTVGAWFAGRRL